jgi:hypothetical protein
VPPTTTTTVAPSTTTTTQAAAIEHPQRALLFVPEQPSESDSETSSAWAWALAALVAAGALIALIAALVRRRHRRAAFVEWQPRALAAVGETATVATLLADVDPGDVAQLDRVRAEVDRVTGALEQLAAAAPGRHERDAAVGLTDRLRGLMLTVEAESILRGGTPTAEQLSAAELARTRDAAALDAALDRLRQESGITSPS